MIKSNLQTKKIIASFSENNISIKGIILGHNINTKKCAAISFLVQYVHFQLISCIKCNSIDENNSIIIIDSGHFKVCLNKQYSCLFCIQIIKDCFSFLLNNSEKLDIVFTNTDLFN